MDERNFSPILQKIIDSAVLQVGKVQEQHRRTAQHSVLIAFTSELATEYGITFWHKSRQLTQPLKDLESITIDVARD